MTVLSRRGAMLLASSAALTPLIGCKPSESMPSSTRWPRPGWMELARSSPTYATGLGDHRFDGEIDDVSATGRAAKTALIKETTDALAAIDRTKLSRDNQVDAAMLAEQLESETFSLDTLQDWAWDPLNYPGLAGGSLYSLVAREFAPLNERLINAASRMEKLPDLLAETRKQLDPARVPLVHAETYSRQNGGAVSIIDDLILAQSAGLGPMTPRASRRLRTRPRRRSPNTRHGSTRSSCPARRAISASALSTTPSCGFRSIRRYRAPSWPPKRRRMLRRSARRCSRSPNRWSQSR